MYIVMACEVSDPWSQAPVDI